jgi:hypothetical protein
MPERCFRVAVLALTAMIPFETRFTLLGLSNLQWMFALAAASSIPFLVRRRYELFTGVVIAAAVFAATQWIAAAAAPDFFSNAAKAALRVTAGVILMAAAAVSRNKDEMLRVWVVGALAAAVYALAAHAGFGVPALFRTEEFYRGAVQRLSGSFDYPNTAAAFFAMTIPLVWMVFRNPAARYASAGLLWLALLLTQSRGGVAALGAAAALAVIGPYSRRAGAGRLKMIGLAAAPGVLIYVLAAWWSAPPSARYELRLNKLQLGPNETGESEITIWNTGGRNWPAEGRRKVALAYRWFDVRRDAFVSHDPVRTNLEETVGAGDRVTLRAPFRTPPDAGKYLLVWELFRDDLDWFSRAGVIPALAEVDIGTAGERRSGHADLSRWYQSGGTDGPQINASVTRPELWTAAIRMWRERPIAGFGPDNFRLRYGSYLGHTKWDTSVRANNLYLELLAGSGVMGFAAFMAMTALKRWDVTPVSLALIVFLAHGLADVFLMTTPVYFGFWILMGIHQNLKETMP